LTRNESAKSLLAKVLGAMLLSSVALLFAATAAAMVGNAPAPSLSLLQNFLTRFGFQVGCPA
jgi:hypothetical protein